MEKNNIKTANLIENIFVDERSEILKRENYKYAKVKINEMEFKIKCECMHYIVFD